MSFFNSGFQNMGLWIGKFFGSGSNCLTVLWSSGQSEDTKPHIRLIVGSHQKPSCGFSVLWESAGKHSNGDGETGSKRWNHALTVGTLEDYKTTNEGEFTGFRRVLQQCLLGGRLSFPRKSRSHARLFTREICNRRNPPGRPVHGHCHWLKLEV
jgi:hypothetical protein